MSSPQQTLELYAPVFVDRGGDTRLEGVIMYLGPVDFASGEDWVGVRLTGESSDRGKNDGSVQGKSYFACPPNGGIFVRASALSRREVTKLEELKLRRELGISARPAISAVSAIPPATPSRFVASGGAAPSSISAATTMAATLSSSSSAAATSPSKVTNKLEELRQRRAALVARKQQQQQQGEQTPQQPVLVGSQVSSPVPSSGVAASSSAAAAVSSSPFQVSSWSSASASVPVGMVAGEDAPETSALVALSSSPPAKVAVAAAATEESRGTIASDEHLTRIQAELETTKRRLAEKELEADKLGSDLREATGRILRLQEQASAAEVASADEAARRLAANPHAPHALSSAQMQEWEQLAATLQEQVGDLERQLREANEEISSYQARIRDADKRAAEDREELARQVAAYRAEAGALRQEIQDATLRNDTRGASDASHYKERAKLQAELAAHRRRIEQLESEKQELEADVEDLTLDKDQLEKEREALENRVEELNFDVENAQLEVEELKVQLEDAREASERAVGASSESSEQYPGAVGGADAEDVIRAQKVQIERLRSALLMQREQLAHEKRELDRQLRDAEKDAEAGRAASGELESLKTLKARMEEEVNELKDRVEESAAFESMVEEMSDRVLAIEDENIGLRSTIRELEEAAELTAEMEELQADELKALNRDLEGRDTIIRNLEEVIKMQRRREDDFLRTVANYRTTVATLNQEKQALLELHQGGEGEKNDLIATSQNALARAAQLVSDAAELRRREAKAAVESIERQIYKSLFERIESMLPHGHIIPELSAIKGEMQASKAVSVASKTLEGIAACFSKTTRSALGIGERGNAMPTAGTLALSDEVRQKITAVFYQAEFSHILIDVSSDLIRLLAAGQWPGVLSHEASIDLGGRLVHSATSIESTLSSVLKCLTEEGVLTPEQSNLEAVRSTLRSNVQALISDLRVDGDKSLVDPDWNPPGFKLLKYASVAKFNCLSVSAALSSIQLDTEHSSYSVSRVYDRVEQISRQSTSVSQRLANLDLTNEGLLTKVEAQISAWKDSSSSLLESAEEALLGAGDWDSCYAQSESTLRGLAALSSSLRAAKTNANEDGSYHALSPESNDCWNKLAALASYTQSLDGDEDDVNFRFRARAVEQRLSSAIEKESKLDVATSRIASLEKSLASKVKEISMMTVRLSELEKLLAKSKSVSTPIGRGLTMDFRSAEEFRALEEENRMLSEAMDVLNRQVGEYENEIRALKDFKSPSKGSRSRATPRRAVTSVADTVSSPHGRAQAVSEEAEIYSGALEATLFRPSLQRALKDAAFWKASVVRESLSNLPALPVAKSLKVLDDQESENGDDLVELTLALADYRIAMASTSLVDLTRKDKTPRAQLRESTATKQAASQRLHAVLRRYQGQSFYC